MHRLLRVKLLVCAVMLGTLGLAGPALALPVPVPVGTSPGDDLLFNFLFPGTMSQVEVQLHLQTAAMNPPQNNVATDLTVDYFTGLSGSGAVTPFLVFGSSPSDSGWGVTLTTLNQMPPSALDGEFSIGLRIGSGAIDLTAITGSGSTALGLPVAVTPTQVPGQIPEPRSLALLLAATGALVSRAYRRVT